jgi:hypothetical protein
MVLLAGAQKEYLDPDRRRETEEAILDVLMEAPREDSEAKLEFFLEGADAIVHHLLTMQNRIESGRVDRLLVWLRAKFGTVGQTKKLSHPIVLITLVINVCLVLGYDNDATPCGNALVDAGGSRSTEDMGSPLINLCLPGLKTFSVRALGDHSHAHPCAKSPPRPQVNTYSRWPPAFYILLGLPQRPCTARDPPRFFLMIVRPSCADRRGRSLIGLAAAVLAPLHVVSNIAVFAAFLRIDAVRPSVAHRGVRSERMGGGWRLTTALISPVVVPCRRSHLNLAGVQADTADR